MAEKVVKNCKITIASNNNEPLKKNLETYLLINQLK